MPAYSTAATPAKSAPNKPAWAATTPFKPFAPADDVADAEEPVAVELVEELPLVVRPLVVVAPVAVAPLPVVVPVVMGVVAFDEDAEVLATPVAVAE